jgi:hypothetical protein
MPDSAQIWHYIVVGDLSAIRTMIANGDASPFDVSIAGMSVLQVGCHFFFSIQTKFSSVHAPLSSRRC